MQLVRYNKPDSLMNELDKLFHSAFFDSFDRLFENTQKGNRVPVTYTSEDTNNLYIKVELPGIKKQDVKIEVDDSVLTVRAHSTVKDKKGSDTVESSYSFERSLQLPSTVASDKINANLDNGLLTITLPKAEERKPRQIAIA